MNLILIPAIFISCILGLYQLNDSGSASRKAVNIVLAVLLNSLSLAGVIYLYGTFRGTFIYLGLASLLGMTITLVRHKQLVKFKQNDNE